MEPSACPLHPRARRENFVNFRDTLLTKRFRDWIFVRSTTREASHETPIRPRPNATFCLILSGRVWYYAWGGPVFNTGGNMAIADLVTVADGGPLTRDEKHSLQQCEDVIRRGQSSFREVGAALLRIRDEKLYRDAHKTFEAYIKEEWDFSRAHAYRLIDASAAVENVSKLETMPAPSNEGQARELAKLPGDQQSAVWEEVVERTDGRPTAAEVRKVVEEKLGNTPRKYPTKSEREAQAEEYEARLKEIRKNKDRSRKLPASARAVGCKEATTIGMPLAEALLQFGWPNQGAYSYASRIVNTGRKPLIDALDSGDLAIGALVRMLDAADAEIAEAIEAAKLKETKKRHKQYDMNTKPKCDIYYDLLEGTWSHWAALRKTMPPSKTAIPRGEERREQFFRLCVKVRELVTDMIDGLEKEKE